MYAHVKKKFESIGFYLTSKYIKVLFNRLRSYHLVNNNYAAEIVLYLVR